MRTVASSARPISQWSHGLALVVAIALISPARAQSVRHPEALKLAEHAHRDQESIDALATDIQALLSAPLVGKDPWETYQRAKAKAWLNFAFDARAQRDQSGAVLAAQAQARTLTEGLARRAPLSLETPLIVSANRLREDVWQWVESAKAEAQGRCAGAELAEIEITLVQAGHADHRLGARHARPYLQALDRLLVTARPLIAHCPPLSGAGLGVPEEINLNASASVRSDDTPTDGADTAHSVAPQSLPDTAGRIMPATDPPQVAVPEPARQPTVPHSTGASSDAVVGRVYFAFNRASVPEASRPELDLVADALKRNSVLTVELRGHTDRQGGRQYNQRLSMRRAEHVRQYLLSAGVDAPQIHWRALGFAQLLSHGSTLRDHARNRRVDIYLSGPHEPLPKIPSPEPIVATRPTHLSSGRTRR